MENRFLNCCFDFSLIGTRSECDRLSCEGNHNPVFNLYYHKVNKEWCYCLNRNQLDQYWQCVAKDRDTFCPGRCDRCGICKEMNDVFAELQDVYFFIRKKNLANNEESKLYQPVLWRVFTTIIDKNKKQFHIQIAKSIPSENLILNYGKTC